MCLGIPGQIAEIIPDVDVATVDIAGIPRDINLGLLTEEGIRPGDWILVHMGFAVERIDEHEAAEALAGLRATSDAFTEELSSRAAATRNR
jgi:hydrogenase expression/formation protein HypC